MELGDMMHAESPPDAMAFPTVSRWLVLAAAGITPRRELATFLKTEAVPQLLDGGEVAFGRDEQILALAASRNGEIRIAAHDQAQRTMPGYRRRSQWSQGRPKTVTSWTSERPEPHPRLSLRDGILRRRLDLVGNATGGKKEESDQCAALDFRIMVASGGRRSPARMTLSVGAGKNRALGQGNHHVQLAIGMCVIVAAIVPVAVMLLRSAIGLHAVHVDRRDAELKRLCARLAYPAAAVAPPVNFDVGRPTLLDPCLDQAGEVVIHGGSRPIGLVEPLLDLGARRHVLDLVEQRNAAADEFLTLSHVISPRLGITSDRTAACSLTKKPSRSEQKVSPKQHCRK